MTTTYEKPAATPEARRAQIARIVAADKTAEAEADQTERRIAYERALLASYDPETQGLAHRLAQLHAAVGCPVEGWCTPCRLDLADTGRERRQARRERAVAWAALLERPRRPYTRGRERRPYTRGGATVRRKAPAPSPTPPSVTTSAAPSTVTVASTMRVAAVSPWTDPREFARQMRALDASRVSCRCGGETCTCKAADR